MNTIYESHGGMIKTQEAKDFLSNKVFFFNKKLIIQKIFNLAIIYQLKIKILDKKFGRDYSKN